MFSNKSSPYLKIRKRVSNYTSKKTKCIQLERDIYNFINLIRKEPSKIIEYFQEAQKEPNYNTNFETQQIFNFINNLSEKNISFSPLNEKSEITKISYDLLNYLINIKKIEGRIKYNNLDEEYINLRIRAAPYGRIKGKYYEAIVLDSVNLLEIISYILKDVKGRNVIFNEKIKYIGIACGFFESINNKNNLYNRTKSNKICTIIDMIQDFEINDLSNYENNIIKEKYKNKTPEIFMRIKTVFKGNDEFNKKRSIKNGEKSHSFDKKSKSTDRLRKYHKLTKDNYNMNKSFDTQKILVEKSPLLVNGKNYTTLYSSRPYESKIKYKKAITPFASFKSKIKNQKLSTLNYRNKIISNNYKNNSFYYLSQYNFNKNNKNNKDKYIIDDLSEKSEINSASFNLSKLSKKKLNRREKIELLKQINKVSRDKSKNKKSKSYLKSEDDSKSISLNNKKNISNDFSFSELISVDNDKKTKDDKEMKNLLKNQLKNEIKKEIEKEVKEELKAELVNKMLLSSSNNNTRPKIPNLKIPKNNNNMISDTSNDYAVSNTNPNNDGKTVENNTNRSISSIDIFFPPNKNITNISKDHIPGIVNYTKKTNYNNNDNCIVKKLVKLYNAINTRQESNRPLTKENSFNDEKNKNINYKIPMNTTNNSFYSNNNKVQKDIYNNKIIIKKKIIKINKLKNVTDKGEKHIINSKSISPKRRSKVSNIPFKKIIVKNNNITKNEKVIVDKIIKIPKKINDVNYLDKNNIIINNKTNNILYIKQVSPKRIPHYGNSKIYEKKPIY